MELGLAGDQVGPGTGPDFLAKHKSGSIDFVESLSENMGIYMEFRKVWPFKCQNSENGTFIILSFFKKKRGFIPGGAEKGGYSGAHPYYVIHRELPPPPPPRPENVVRGDQKLCKRSPYNASLKLSKTYVKY